MFDPELINELAEVFAQAAFDELFRDPNEKAGGGSHQPRPSISTTQEPSTCQHPAASYNMSGAGDNAPPART